MNDGSLYGADPRNALCPAMKRSFDALSTSRELVSIPYVVIIQPMHLLICKPSTSTSLLLQPSFPPSKHTAIILSSRATSQYLLLPHHPKPSTMSLFFQPSLPIMCLIQSRNIETVFIHAALSEMGPQFAALRHWPPRRVHLERSHAWRRGPEGRQARGRFTRLTKLQATRCLSACG